MRERLALLALTPLLLAGLAYTLLRYPWAALKSPRKAWAIARMIDETANVGLNGQVNTTISGRAGRARVKGRRWGCLLCRLLDAIDPGHCDKEVLKEASLRGPIVGKSV